MAQSAGLKPLPAVPPLKADVRQAAIAPAPAAAVKSPVQAAVPTLVSDPPPSADPAAEQQAVTEGDKPPQAQEPAVQEAKNNSSGVIDATSDKAGDKADDKKADNANSIVATVNDETISDFELRQRVALYLALNNINQQLTPEQKTRIRTQLLEVLESEKLQLQEAQKKKITVSPLEVDKRINGMTQDNRFTIEQLRQNLKAAGASEDALRAQITASIAWQKAVQDEYSDRVNVTPEMISAEMARNAESANKPHYRVLEIFLPVDNPELDPKVKKEAEDVQNQLRQGAPFQMVARQFSQHPSAATGGYYILGLRERQEPLGTKIQEVPTGPTGPEGTLPLARLLFPVDPRAPKAQLEEIFKVAAQIQTHYGGCAQLDDLHNKMSGTVYMDLGNAKLAELSPQIQEAMKATRPGEAAMPFMSEAGVELIGRCDKRIEVKTAYVMPTREQVEDQLFQSQIAALARRYLRDLKRDANIQLRDDSKPDALIR